MWFYNFIRSIVTFFEPGAINEFGEFEGFMSGFFSFLANLFM